MRSSILSVVSVISCGAFAASNGGSKSRPVIGVLSEPNVRHTEYYVATSYVKWLEAAGARSLPIPYDADESTVETIFGQVNGVLLPGGSDNKLPNAAKYIWALSKKSNDEGNKFPIWATCLGFEYLLMLQGVGGEEILQDGFDAWNISMALTYTDAVQSSKVLQDGEVRKIAGTQRVTMNNHMKGIEPETFARDGGLSSMFTVIATNLDRKGRPFVSMIEANDYPFYGVQFHPEKNSFEFGTIPGTDIPYENINHSADAVRMTLHMAQFFVSEARDNNHTYSDVEAHPLIWSYEMLVGTAFEQRFIISRKYVEDAGDALVAKP